MNQQGPGPMNQQGPGPMNQQGPGPMNHQGPGPGPMNRPYFQPPHHQDRFNQGPHPPRGKLQNKSFFPQLYKCFIVL
jgi:hypothetical protein